MLESKQNLRVILIMCVLINMGKGRGVYRVLVRKPEGNGLLENPRCRWEDNIKMDLQEVGWGTCTGLSWLKIEKNGGQL
jgi:hypothetical protein